MKEKEPQPDHWERWTQAFVDAGYEEEYVKKNMEYYKEMVKNPEAFPEGEEFATNILKLRFRDILDSKL